MGIFLIGIFSEIYVCKVDKYVWSNYDKSFIVFIIVVRFIVIDLFSVNLLQVEQTQSERQKTSYDST